MSCNRLTIKTQARAVALVLEVATQTGDAQALQGRRAVATSGRARGRNSSLLVLVAIRVETPVRKAKGVAMIAAIETTKMPVRRSQIQ